MYKSSLEGYIQQVFKSSKVILICRRSRRDYVYEFTIHMASQSSNTVSVNVGALSTAIAVAIQQATQLGSTGTGAPVADAAAPVRAERRYFYIATHAW